MASVVLPSGIGSPCGCDVSTREYSLSVAILKVYELKGLPDVSKLEGVVLVIGVEAVAAFTAEVTEGVNVRVVLRLMLKEPN